MAKCMVKKDGKTVVRVSKAEAEQLYRAGEATYIDLDTYRKLSAGPPPQSDTYRKDGALSSTVRPLGFISKFHRKQLERTS